MVKTIQGKIAGKGKRIAIVASRFNEFVTQRLVRGCLEQLESCSVAKDNITLVWVPGAFEIPLVALKLARKKNIDAVICLGVIIRGETLHFELVAQETAHGIAQTSLLSGKPVIFEVLATETADHAYKRSKKKGDNKGRDAALAAIEMIDLFSKI